MRVFDNMLRLNQDDIQAGIKNFDIAGDPPDGVAIVDDDVDGEPADDGLECPLMELGEFESCLTPFATGVDLEHHMIGMHDYSREGARDTVREAEIALRERVARRS